MSEEFPEDLSSYHLDRVNEKKHTSLVSSCFGWDMQTVTCSHFVKKNIFRADRQTHHRLEI